MQLDDLLDLKRMEDGAFCAETPTGQWRRPFGGHLLAQSLAAGRLTVDTDKAIHNMQTQFLRSGRAGQPIHYHVEELREGKRFATRRVSSMQEDRILTESLLSFHMPEPGLDYQPPLPPLPLPDNLPTEQELRHAAAASSNVQWCLPPLLPDLPVELRPVQERNFIDPPKLPGRLDFWARPNQPVAHANGDAFVACLTDVMLLSAVLLPHGISWSTTPVEGSTLNHSLWFHRAAPLSGWLLWSMEVEWTGATRGLVHGRLWSAEGELIASAMQEGLVRVR